MNQTESTIAVQEVNKFAQLAEDWWDTDGPLRTLHDINGARFEFISQHINLQGLRVLDVGCGGGILSESMTKAGAHVTGIDAESETIQVAKAHAKKNHLPIDYFCSAIEEYEAQCFDVVTCMELLEHVQNPDLVLRHCRRLLKPNGILFLSTISRTLKAYLGAIVAAEYILGLLPRQTHDYDKFIKPSELAKMARPFGLNIIDMKGLCYNPFTRKTSLMSDVSINYIMVLQ